MAEIESSTQGRCLRMQHEEKEEMRSLIVRDRATGEPVAIPISSIPEEIRPDNFQETMYWMHKQNRGELEPLIGKLFRDEPLNWKDLPKLRQYIIDYAGNVAVAAWLFSGPEEKDNILRVNGEAMRRLRAVEVTSNKDIKEMIRIGMQYAIDPF